MATWQVHEAVARFSELIDEAQTNGPQMIMRDGFAIAVLLSSDDYRALNAGKKPSFTEYLLSGPKVDDFEIVRDQDTGREIDL